jgi:hypothetical protein
MDGIYTLADELITDHIRDAIPNKIGAKTVNRLFDGTWHVQTYGDASDVLELVVFADQTGLRRLNQAQAEGEMLKVEVLNEDFYGTIEDKIPWRESGPGYYQATFTLLIIEPEE